ncbi:hypothetical protein IGI04_019745 [Brassica rapa subsp. trilocularis]|uniref:Non-specific serine/threonine protein kinase n=2 Tax=Brassica TaxID=3705 RepID=A0ABQ7XAU0_BRANA|nr:hypothetical protein IGI04_019745 [Brassica rapa subsp. trilocularis]KAH0853086.1 hypothetical protein HID58_093459 [Brassica napus]
MQATESRESDPTQTKGIRGTLPLNLQTLTELIVLDIFQNRVSGPIPDLSGLTRIHTLNLHDNLFDYVPIPKNLFSGMTFLQEAYLENNPFSPWEMAMDKHKTGHTMTAGIADRFSVIYNVPFSDAPDAEEANTYAGNERGGAYDMVVDVLIHHTRSLLLSHSEQPQSKTLFSLTRNLFPYFPRRSITLGRCFYHNVAGVDVCNCINPDVLDVEVQRTAVMIYEDNVEVYDSSFPTSA